VTAQNEKNVPDSSATSALSEEEQKRIIMENRSLWSFDEDEYSPDWYFAFTDLDHNGLFEVLAAFTQGSGIYTYVHFFEVMPDGSGIRNLYHADVEVEGPDDWPEIILDTLTCYYDSAADRYYYVCTNNTRDGAWHGLTQIDIISLAKSVPVKFLPVYSNQTDLQLNCDNKIRQKKTSAFLNRF